MKAARFNNDIFQNLCLSESLEVAKEVKFHPVRRWKFDYAILVAKIAIEVEGGAWTLGRHNRPKGFIADMKKYNAAAVLGWRILRFTPQQLMTFETIETLKQIIKKHEI